MAKYKQVAGDQQQMPFVDDLLTGAGASWDANRDVSWDAGAQSDQYQRDQQRLGNKNERRKRGEQQHEKAKADKRAQSLDDGYIQDPLNAPRAYRVVNVPVAEEMSDSFLAYGLSVITARAIPDVRDGLKPVQRRILWAMLQMGVRPGTPFRKSARIVGDTMGRYHPHGDSAIYDALVRLGQSFNRRVPLVDPQGNFGSLDDPPAAARYTECRLSKAAMDIVSEVDEDTVDFLPTYDGEGSEPSVLPAAFPNLIVNGTSGIAVGMATNMAPHNLGEICAAVELVLDSREANTTIDPDEFFRKVPGPDFPSGGRVVDYGLRRMYESGRGPVRVQAKATLENVARDTAVKSVRDGTLKAKSARDVHDAIIITELPYQVGPERVVDRVAKLIDDGVLDGVAGIADLSDTDGLRIQVKLKLGVDAQAVLSELYRTTAMEETFHVNNVVLVDGVPTTVGLMKLCDRYIDHRLEVILRRTQYRRSRAVRRLEIVEGLLTALDNVDEVVSLIRASRSSSDALQALISQFGFTEIQATHILDMPMRRLTSLEKQKLVDESEALNGAISDYGQVLTEDRRRLQMVRSELRRIAAAHGTPRRSEIVSESDAGGFVSDMSSDVDVLSSNLKTPTDETQETDETQDTVSASESARRGALVSVGEVGKTSHVDSASESSSDTDMMCEVTVSTSGYLGRSLVQSDGSRSDASATGVANRGQDVSESKTSDEVSLNRHDLLAASVVTFVDTSVALVTSYGRIFAVRAGDVPDAASSLRGADVASTFGLEKSERVLALMAACDDGLSDKPSEDLGERLVVVTETGLVCRFDNATVMATGQGEFVIGLQSDDRVAAAFLASDKTDLVIVASDAKALRVPSSAFPLKSAGSAGVIGMRLRAGVNVVTAGVAAAGVAAELRVAADAECVSAASVVVMSTSAGGLKTTQCDELVARGRGGRGVLIAKLADQEKIAAAVVASMSTADLWLLSLKMRDDEPSEVDPHPVAVKVEPTGRYAAPKPLGKQIAVLALGRCYFEPLTGLA